MEVAEVKKNGRATTVANVSIPALDYRTVSFRLRGTAPYVQNKFPAKVREEMRLTQEAGSTATKGKKRAPKDFEAAYNAATHFSQEGWCGIPATAFRNAMISACKIVGFHMTKGKISVFVEADGYDPDDGTPLVRFEKGERQYHETAVRVGMGVADIRARPMWPAGWELMLRVKYDAGLFTLDDITNLLVRAGIQVGVGEGRNDSKSSNGMGWGSFEIISE